MPFNIGLTGLNAASSDLNVTGNNIANASTAGFKGSRAEFADIFATSRSGVSKTAIGNGVKLAAVSQNFSQGNLEFTGRSLDMAINGDGFFVLKSGDGIQYTRAGQFQVDREGFVVNSAGQRLQGFPNPGQVGAMQDLRLTTGLAAPQQTSVINALMNLPASAVEPEAEFAFDEDTGVADPDGYNHSTAVTVYDSQGLPRTLTLYFRKVGEEESNEWQVFASSDGQEIDLDPAGFTFAEDGTLQGEDGEPFPPLNLTIPTAGGPNAPADPIEIELNLSDTTQYGDKFSVIALEQDGFTSGQLIGVDVGDDGVVFARFTSGATVELGQVALANFTNPQSLKNVGGTNWVETFESGQPLMGAPGDNGFGLLQAGAFEGSNVDIAEQLVKLISAQRNFQANAQVISTADTLTQTIINIR